MRNKLLAVISICALMIMMLGACGGSGQDSTTTDNNDDTAVESTQSGSEEIDLGEKVIIDDDYVTVKASKFYTYDWNGNPAKCLELKVTNNLDRDILFNLPTENTYLGDEQIENVWLDGNAGPMPGKTNTYGYRIYRQSGSEETELDSLEDLYGLNGKIEINVFSEDKSSTVKDKEREYTYDLNELK